MLFGFLKIDSSSFMTQIVPFLPVLTLIMPIVLKGVFLDFSEIGNQSVEIVNQSLHDTNSDTESTTSENELVSKKNRA